jgi:hypothetical protein
MMKPVSIEKKGSDFVILHKCVVCGFERKNKVVEGDEWGEVLRVSSNVQ